MPVAMYVAIAAAVWHPVVVIAGDGVLIADSLAEFSSKQSANGWHYGYYATDGDPGSFTELCCYDALGLLPWWERSATQPPWNLVWPNGQRPDLTWTVGRWEAEVTGLVRIDITTGHWEGQSGARTSTATPGSSTIRASPTAAPVSRRWRTWASTSSRAAPVTSTATTPSGYRTS